jgi:hypothetical protein
MQVAAFLILMTFAVQATEQRLGPFTIAGQTFTVTASNQRLEIRDEANTVGKTTAAWVNTGNR